MSQSTFGGCLQAVPMSAIREKQIENVCDSANATITQHERDLR